MFSEIINPFLNVRNKVKDTSGNWVDFVKPREEQYTVRGARVPVTPSHDEVVIDVWDKRVIIDSLSMASNTTAFPCLWVKEGESDILNNFFRAVTRTGGTSSPWPEVISFQGHSLLELGNYTLDEDDGGFTVFLKRPLEFPNGCKLIFLGEESSNGEMSYHVNWREIKEDA